MTQPIGSTAPIDQDTACCAPTCCADSTARPGLLARAAAALRTTDRVVVVFAALIGVLYVFDPAQGTETLRFTGAALLGIAPFLLASVVLAAGLKASGADDSIARVFSGSPVRTILAAAAFGALSPFCSCGVVPIVAALLAAGVPLAPVMAFCLSSPVMDPEMFILMAAETGIAFTVAKTAAAIGIGLFGGFVTHLLAATGGLGTVLREGMGGGCGSSCGQSAVLRRSAIVWTFWREPDRRRAFTKSAGDTAVFLGKWLALAFALESLMVAHIPAEWIASTLGTGAWWTVPAAALAGVPAYLNGYAAIPLVASLMDMGLGAGAALAFMVAGGVTSAPAALAVFAVVRPRVFALYLALAFAGSVIAGVVYGAVA